MEIMPTPAERRRKKLRAFLMVVILLVIAAAALALIFHKNNKAYNNASTASANKSSTNQTTFPGNRTQIESLISFELPANWTDTDCIGATETVLIIPNQDVRPNCAIDLQNWSVKMVMDTHNTTSCSQIKVDNSQVTNHVCSTVPVNGVRLVKSSTTYNDKSSYGHATKVSDYFIKTKNGVVKLEYIDNLTSTNDDYQTGYDQLANSIKVK
jgi:hypothetical protein